MTGLKTCIDIAINKSITIHLFITRKCESVIGALCNLYLSSRAEAMGRVLLKGIVAGKPRVSARNSDTPTVINSGKDGFLFETENNHQFSGILRQFMCNAPLQECLSKITIKANSR